MDLHTLQQFSLDDVDPELLGKVLQQMNKELMMESPVSTQQPVQGGTKGAHTQRRKDVIDGTRGGFHGVVLYFPKKKLTHRSDISQVRQSGFNQLFQIKMDVETDDDDMYLFHGTGKEEFQAITASLEQYSSPSVRQKIHFIPRLYTTVDLPSALRFGKKKNRSIIYIFIFKIQSKIVKNLSKRHALSMTLDGDIMFSTKESIDDLMKHSDIYIYKIPLV